MRWPRWLTRNRSPDDRDAASGVLSAKVMGQLQGLRWELEQTVRGLESMVDDDGEDTS